MECVVEQLREEVIGSNTKFQSLLIHVLSGNTSDSFVITDNTNEFVINADGGQVGDTDSSLSDSVIGGRGHNYTFYCSTCAFDLIVTPKYTLEQLFLNTRYSFDLEQFGTISTLKVIANNVAATTGDIKNIAHTPLTSVNLRNTSVYGDIKCFEDCVNLREIDFRYCISPNLVGDIADLGKLVNLTGISFWDVAGVYGAVEEFAEKMIETSGGAISSSITLNIGGSGITIGGSTLPSGATKYLDFDGEGGYSIR